MQKNGNKPSQNDVDALDAEAAKTAQRGRKLTDEEVLVAKLMQARQILASRGRMIADLKAENARLQGEVMALAAQIEDGESAALRQEYEFPSRYTLQKQGEDFFLFDADETK